MIEIRTLAEGDLHDLKILYKDAFGTETDYAKMLSVFNKIEKNANYIILCAKSEGQVVGSVLGVICSELIGNCTPFMVIEDVTVLSTHRRKGIAKQLLLKIEEYARKGNCNMILFVSSIHREGAHKLYESLGYGVDEVNGYRKRLKI